MTSELLCVAEPIHYLHCRNTKRGKLYWLGRDRYETKEIVAFIITKMSQTLLGISSRNFDLRKMLKYWRDIKVNSKKDMIKQEREHLKICRYLVKIYQGLFKKLGLDWTIRLRRCYLSRINKYLVKYIKTFRHFITLQFFLCNWGSTCFILCLWWSISVSWLLFSGISFN